MKIASSSGESDAGARAVKGEDDPYDDENDEENDDDQKCSTAQHLLTELQDGGFVRVPDAEADTKDCRDGLQSLMKVSQFS